MKIHNFAQGTPEWHAHRAACHNASDAPAMMGVSRYKTRSVLIRERATGIQPEYDAATLARFASGHAAEASARPIAEEIIGSELFPVTGEIEIAGLRLSASSDGLDMEFVDGWEHKQWNEALAAQVTQGIVPASHSPQLTQQVMVFGLRRVLFMVSDGTPDKCVHCWYTPTDEDKSRLLAGWKQFHADVAAYQPEPIVEEVIGHAPETLPALFVRVEGRVVAGDMLAHRAMVSDWVKRLPARFETDQDFADGVAAVKSCEKAEGDLKALAQQVRGQMATVDEVFRLIEEATKEISTARLRIDKSVKAEKDRKRLDEVTRGRNAFAAHCSALNERVGGMMPGAQAGAWGEAIKGLKTLDRIREAIDAELARAKIEANEVADRIQANKEAAADCMHLFPDFGAVCQKDYNDFLNLMGARKAEADRREAERLEADRARIRTEEQARAERESLAKARAEQDARDAETARQRALEQDRMRQERATELARIEAEQKEAIRVALEAQRAEQEETKARNAEIHKAIINETAPAPDTDTGATMKLGEICERLGFTVTAQFLAGIGFDPVGHERAAKLYRECDFRAICIALVKRITTLYQPTSKE